MKLKGKIKRMKVKSIKMMKAKGKLKELMEMRMKIKKVLLRQIRLRNK